jgi:Flp pilus assembly protein CpaB
MRPRTFLLLILVLVAAAALVLLIVFQRSDILSGDSEPEAAAVEEAASAEAEPGEPIPTPTPQVQFESVVVALADLPVGERITRRLITVENRPATNVAVVAGVTFSDPELVDGQIVKTAVSRGQEILRPMLALNPSDIATMGSDLSLYVDQGKVAVAFPIDRFSGAAYAIRPGDLVDSFMTLQMVDLDIDFQTELPNITQRVNESDLLAGSAFLFPATQQGRLELIPVLNAVANIGPGQGKEPIPRRVTQLTLQQMEVLWMGTWRDPGLGMQQEFVADAVKEAPSAPVLDENGQPLPPPVPTKQRPEDQPDVVILSMTAQDALALKWALDTGINIDLVLRAQGDNSVFVTTSVSLPQIFEQGILTAPEPREVGLEPRIDQLPAPFLPPNPP